MRKILLNCVALLISILLTLVCLELVARVYQRMIDRKVGEDNTEAFLHEYDPIRGWRNKPNASAEFVNQKSRIHNLVKINSQGLRDEEISYDKPEGALRILLLDASAIAGFEVPQDAIVDRVLESMLSKKQKCQVINGATRAYGTDQSLLFLMSEGVRYRPDIIVYVVSELDLDDNLVIHKDSRSYGKSYFQIKSDGSLELKGVPVPQKFIPHDRTLMSEPLAQQYVDMITGKGSTPNSPAVQPISVPKASCLGTIRKFLYDHSALYRLIIIRLKQSPRTRHWLQRMGLSRERDLSKPRELIELEWKTTEALLGEMKKYADQMNAKLAFYEFSNGLSPNTRLDHLEHVCQNLRVPLMRTYGVFHKAQTTKARPTFARDGHWNIDGHKLAAEIIFNFLESQGWLKPSPPKIATSPTT